MKTPEHEAPRDQDLRKRLAAAGLRPAIPPSAFAAIRQAAQVEWEANVADRQRRSSRRPLRRIAAAAGLGAVALLLWWRLAPSTNEPVAIVDLVVGSGSELAAGDGLPVGSVVHAGATESGQAVAIRLRDGQSLRLRAGSRVQLLSSSELELERGALYFDSDRALEGATVRIVTPLGTIRNIGTQFEADLAADGGSLLVRVRSGRVELEREGGSLVAGEREQLIVSADGSVSRSASEPHGAVWSWTLAAAPPLAIDGVRLMTFLDWIGQETGWRIEFETPALQESAAETRLYGDLEGFDPLTALELVLPTAEMTYEVRDAVLIVRQGSASDKTAE